MILMILDIFLKFLIANVCSFDYKAHTFNKFIMWKLLIKRIKNENFDIFPKKSNLNQSHS
jgi:hypothetical protein